MEKLEVALQLSTDQKTLGFEEVKLALNKGNGSELEIHCLPYDALEHKDWVKMSEVTSVMNDGTPWADFEPDEENEEKKDASSPNA